MPTPYRSEGALLGWAVGSLGIAAAFNALNVLLLRYLTDVVGVAAALAGALIAGSKLYDALIDPWVGHLSDRTRSRWGARRPYLLAGGLGVAGSVAMLFTLAYWGPGSAVATTLALLAFATAYAVFNVPYLAMPAEIDGAAGVRVRMMSYRVLAVAGGTLFGTAVAPLILAATHGGAAGHLRLALALAIAIAATSVLCFALTASIRAPRPAATGHAGLAAQLSVLRDCPAFTALLGAKLFTLMGLACAAAMPYLFSHVLGVGDAALGRYFLIYSLAMMASQPLWVRAARRWSRRACFAAGLIGFALLNVSWLLAAPGEPGWAIDLRALLLGTAGGGQLLMGQTLLPDAIEYDRLTSGRRREGVLAGLYTTVEKLAFALGSGLLGLFLGAMGYDGAALAAGAALPPSARLAVYLAAAVFPLVTNVLACLCLLGYRLGEQAGDDDGARTAAVVRTDPAT